MSVIKTVCKGPIAFIIAIGPLHTGFVTDSARKCLQPKTCRHAAAKAQHTSAKCPLAPVNVFTKICHVARSARGPSTSLNKDLHAVAKGATPSARRHKHRNASLKHISKKYIGAVLCCVLCVLGPSHPLSV